MHRLLCFWPLALCVASLLSFPLSAWAELGLHLQPALGKPAPHGFEAVVAPDGSGAPAGEGTAEIGRPLYDAHCAACHGLDGKLAGNAIAGGIGSLRSARPNKTVGSYWPYATTLFDYINRAMPYGNEKSLQADEVYAITAYVLHLNGLVPTTQVINADNLSHIEMPNRNGFRELPGFRPISAEATR